MQDPEKSQHKRNLKWAKGISLIKSKQTTPYATQLHKPLKILELATIFTCIIEHIGQTD